MARIRRFLPASFWVGIIVFALNSPAATIHSLSGRFIVSGEDPIRNFETVRWAENSADRLDQLGEWDSRPLGEKPIEIILDKDSMVSPAVEIRILHSDTGLRRILNIKLSLPLDTFVMQQGLVHLMLAGLIEGRRREAHLSPLIPAIPAWVSVGLAGSLDRGQVARSRTIAAEMILGGGESSLQDVLKWTTLPEGWHSRQALCVLVMDWLMSHPGAQSNLLDRLVMQQPLTSTAVAEVIGVSSLSLMETGWRTWLSQQQQLIQNFGLVSLEMIDQLRAEIWLQSSVEDGAGLVRQGLSPAEVISVRGQRSDIAALAARKMFEIQRLTLGAAPEFVEVGNKFVRFYEGVACGEWSVVLKWRLSRAERALSELARQTLQRKVYLDEFEKTFSKNHSDGLASGRAEGIPEFEKSSMESYLDAAEKRFDKLQ